MNSIRMLWTAPAVMIFVGAANATPINLIAYADAGPNIVDFEDVAGAAFPGINYDTVLSTGGVTIGERFDGQVLGTLGDNDTLSGSPTGPLTLVAGAPGQNLAIGTDSGDNGLYPWGPIGSPAGDAYGEGAFAVLFPGGVSSFGFVSEFGGGSNVFVDVFNATGGLIDSLTVGVGAFGFSREGGLHDIAGFSVYTDDLGGLAYLEMRYGDVSALPLPLPATLPLIIAGLGGLTLLRRRRLAND